MEQKINYKNPEFYFDEYRSQFVIVDKVKANTLPTLHKLRDYYELHMFEDGYIGVFNTRRKRYLKPHIKDEKDNYFCYGLRTIDKTSKTAYVHRLVGLWFVEGWDIGKVIDHLDNDKQNNLMNNLEWVTGKVNTQRAVKDGLGVGRPRVFKIPKERLTALQISQISSKGKKGLTYEQVGTVFDMAASGYGAVRIAKELNVTQPCISQILAGKRWREHPARQLYRSNGKAV